MSHSPEDYGPGKPVSGQMMEDLVRVHGHKFIIMLMHRLGARELVLNSFDVTYLQSISDAGESLIVKPVTEGIYLKIGHL